MTGSWLPREESKTTIAVWTVCVCVCVWHSYYTLIIELNTLSYSG